MLIGLIDGRSSRSVAAADVVLVRRSSMSRKFVAVDDSAFHYKANLAHRRAILPWSARNSDEIGKFSRLDAPDPIVPADYLRIETGCGDETRGARFPELVSLDELLPIFPMLDHGRVGPEPDCNL